MSTETKKSYLRYRICNLTISFKYQFSFKEDIEETKRTGYYDRQPVLLVILDMRLLWKMNETR